MARMNISITGTVFTDFLLNTVGAAAFQIEHDWFIKQDLVIRDAAAGAGNLLIEGVDYNLIGEATDLSARVTAAVGAGRNVYTQIQVINAAYQACNLYFTGKYVADSVDAFDDQSGYLAVSTTPYAVVAYSAAIIDFTTGAGNLVPTLPAAKTCLDWEVDLRKADSDAGKVQVTPTAGDYLADVLNGLWEVTEQGGHLRIRSVRLSTSTYGWKVMSQDGSIYQYISAADVAAGGTTANTWYNPANHSLTTPGGVFEWDFTVLADLTIGAGLNTDSLACLSTTNNGASDNGMVSEFIHFVNAVELKVMHSRSKRYIQAGSTTRYLNIQSKTNNATAHTTRGSVATTVVRAKRVT